MKNDANMPPDAAAASLKAARTAWAHKDSAAALEQLQKARAADLGSKLPDIRLLLAEVLRQTGKLAEADMVLAKVQADHPDDLWAPYHRAVLAQRRKDIAAAWAHLGAARANDAEGRIALDLLEADLLQDVGRADAATGLLRALIEKHPDTIAAHQRLATIAEEQKDPARARQAFEAAVKIAPDRLPLQFGLVRQLLALGEFETALARLEKMRAQHGPKPQIMMTRVRACRMAKQDKEELAALSAMMSVHPRDPQLLRHLFATRAKDAAPETLEAVLDLVRRRQGTDLADDLEIKMGLQTMQFHATLDALRHTGGIRRNAAEAQSLIPALFGAHHYRTGMRYLRACLHRWPENQGFLGAYVHHGTRLGQVGEVAERLAAMEDRLPRHVVLGHRLTLCGYLADLPGAIEVFVELRAMGLARAPQRWMMHKLVFAFADPTEAENIYARIGPPTDPDNQSLLRIGLPGLMAMEFDFERKTFPIAPGMALADVCEWVEARPGSPVAAIRLIDAWKHSPQPADSAVPRQIFQYWDAAKPPDAIKIMTKSWAEAPGFSHELYTQTSARKFLRETFTPDWVRAFNLAKDAAQQADFLRLCLLAQFGGIWADADDCLYGDLGKLLGAGSGLLLYREPGTGAIGNNFLAAPPEHPVIVYAARLARQALLQRASESAWLKTGPGVVTRAVAQFLVKTDPDQASQQLTILDWPQVAGEVAMHNPARYKSARTYWNQKYDRREEKPAIFWEQFLTALRAAK